MEKKLEPGIIMLRDVPSDAELARIHAELRQLTRGQTVIVIPRKMKTQ